MNVATILKGKGRMVVTLKPDSTLLEAAQSLAAHRIGAAVVVDANQRLKGIVSERDIVKALAKSGAASLTTPIAEIMSSPVSTCAESDSIDQVMALMTERRFRHVPVIEHDDLIGIISIGDVVKLKIAETELEVAAMRDYIVAR